MHNVLAMMLAIIRLNSCWCNQSLVLNDLFLFFALRWSEDHGFINKFNYFNAQEAPKFINFSTALFRKENNNIILIYIILYFVIHIILIIEIFFNYSKISCSFYLEFNSNIIITYYFSNKCEHIPFNNFVGVLQKCLESDYFYFSFGRCLILEKILNIGLFFMNLTKKIYMYRKI